MSKTAATLADGSNQVAMKVGHASQKVILTLHEFRFLLSSASNFCFLLSLCLVFMTGLVYVNSADRTKMTITTAVGPRGGVWHLINHLAQSIVYRTEVGRILGVKTGIGMDRC